MPRTAQQVEQLKGERRQALLAVARRVFARKGLAATKIGEIAAEVGISYGLVYHYFPQKESLFAAALEDTLQHWDVFLAEVRRQAHTPWERLETVCTRMIHGVHESPESLFLVVRALTEDDAPPLVRDALRLYRQRVLEQVAALIEEGQRAGSVLPGAPLDLARALMALLHGLALSRAVDEDLPPPPLEVLLRLLKAPPAPEKKRRTTRAPRSRR
ncbi:TetR/AcrR family transcriptional regulator [Archangium primigenium]|uniref:TetR/AcrR family transcriptional regulator n=1 Tax=[Archangium] primigenium TaxID=2792470 RepID=UPI0019599ABC|nr:TetR/AcrR family transcriptional regulator [Archangium primigenium]MBM7116775.1 TetR/AcrR family transcriptional regulator [Archangium primigenium]